MGNPLRSEIVTPIHSYTFRLVATAASCGVISAAVALYAGPSVDVPPPPQPVTQEVLALVPMPVVVAVEQPAPPVRSSELQLVFRAAGTTYMKLASIDDAKTAEAMPKHGKLKLYNRGELDHWQSVSVGAVADRDVPLVYRRWTGKAVVVDGACTAKVTVVARLLGETDYADTDANAWTAQNVFDQGAPVLAAKLDGCKDGTFARDAALPAVVTPTVIDDNALAKRARAKLLASEPSKHAQLEWEKAKREGDWHTRDTASINTIIVRHPTTNATWVSVHARIEEGCGGTEINIWGLYRVDGDQLVTAQQRDLGEVHSIDQLVDIEGDGELEYIGKPWIATDIIVSRASGDEVQRLVLPFYGCAC